MKVLEGGILLTALLLVAATAAAQEPEPTLNESELDDSTPTADESYLSEAEVEAGLAPSDEPTLTESDFDTSPPPSDESYLDDEETAAPGSSDARTPGLALVVVLGVLAAAALIARRR